MSAYPEPQQSGRPPLWEFRALGVDYTDEGRMTEIVSGPTLDVDALDLANDADPPYDAILVQRRRLGEWQDVQAEDVAAKTGERPS